MDRQELFRRFDSNESYDEEPIFGYRGPFGTGRKSILVVDDKTQIIAGFINAARRNDEKLSGGNFHFFRLADAPGAIVDDLLEHLRNSPPYDGIFLDGQLGGQGDGTTLAEKIREIPEMVAQPIAIITADDSWVDKNRSKTNLRIMGKFEADTTANTLKRLVVELPDLQAAVRDRLWSDIQFEVARRMAQGSDAAALAKYVGDFLERNYRVCGWYLREERANAGEMQTVASKDYYGVGDVVPRSARTPFFSQHMEDEKRDPWDVKNCLTGENVGRRVELIGSHCALALLGPRGDGGQGTFSIYRSAQGGPFDRDDARELHHVGLQIRSALEQEKLVRQQGATASAIGQIMSATGSNDAAQILKGFVHEQANVFPPSRGKTKTTVRLFKRGCGELVRWGGEADKNQRLGLFGDDGRGPKIMINNLNSVYSRAVLLRETQECEDVEARNPSTVESVAGVQSFLTVPIMHGGGVLGAVNLEASFKEGYTRQDRVMVEALAAATASAIYGQRADRFMKGLASLAARAVRPLMTEEAKPQAILAEAANEVYLLCGFSNLILLERPTEGEDFDSPWEVVAGWTGLEEAPIQDGPEQLALWKLKLDKDWNQSFIRYALAQSRDSVLLNEAETQIAQDDGIDNIRAPGRPTLRQLVIKIGPGRNARSLLSILFEHPHPFPASYLPVLGAFADFMTAVYEADQVKVRYMGRSLSTQRAEATLGRMYGQMRHAIVSRLTEMKSGIKIEQAKGTPNEVIIASVFNELESLEERVTAKSHRIKVPVLTGCCAAEIWNGEVHGLKNRIAERGIQVSKHFDNRRFFADVDMIESALFDLLDNILVHGKTARHAELIVSDEMISVCDDGEAIDPKIVPVMFNPGITTSTAGQGQGLHLCRDMVELMGGTVSYKRYGGKNCFEIKLRPYVENE